MKIGKIIYCVDGKNDVKPYIVAKVESDCIYLLLLDVNSSSMNFSKCFEVKTDKIIFDCFELKDGNPLNAVPGINYIINYMEEIRFYL